MGIFLAIFFHVKNSSANPEDLTQAFNSLKKSMGAQNAPPADPETDRILESAFEEIPEVLQNSNVPLEDLTEQKSNLAIGTLAGASTLGAFDVASEGEGPLLSLALWSGSQTALEKVVQKILSQLYADGDIKKFRIFLNSNPMPSLNAELVDLNQERRTIEWNHYALGLNHNLISASELERMKKNFSYRTPKDPAYAMYMSAGLFANLQNLDELAGQIALKLALRNPSAFGFKEDPRYKRNKDILELIDKAIRENWSDQNLRFLNQKRAEILAEFSAIERMNQAHFNPMAIADFEERVHGWISDIFMKRKIHFLTRKVSKIQDYEFADWTRPLRLQAQENHIFELQGVERGRHMNQKYTELPKSLKPLRFRLMLFTKWFFAGSVKQIAPLVLISGATLTHLFAPEVTHAALSAVAATSSDVIRSLIANPPVAQSLNFIGHYVDMSLLASQQLMETVFASLPMEYLRENLTLAWSVFSEKFETALMVGGLAISSAIIIKNYSELLRFFDIVLRGPPESRFPPAQNFRSANDSKAKNPYGTLGSGHLRNSISGAKPSETPALSESELQEALGSAAARAGWGFRFGTQVRRLVNKFILRNDSDKEVGRGITVELERAAQESQEDRSLREIFSTSMKLLGARAQRVATRSSDWLKPKAEVVGGAVISVARLGPRAAKGTLALGGYLILRAPTDLKDFGRTQFEDLKMALEKRSREYEEKRIARERLKKSSEEAKSKVARLMYSTETSEYQILRLMDDMLKAIDKDKRYPQASDEKILSYYGLRTLGRSSRLKIIQESTMRDDVDVIFNVVDRWTKIVDIRNSPYPSTRQLKITALLENLYQKTLSFESAKEVFMQRLQRVLPVLQSLEDQEIRAELATAQAGSGGYDFLVAAMNSYPALNDPAPKSGKELLKILGNSRDFNAAVFEKLIRGNELKVLKYLTSGESGDDEFFGFFKVAFPFYARPYRDAFVRNQMKLAVGRLSATEKVVLFVNGNRRNQWPGISTNVNFEDTFAPLFEKRPLQKAVAEVVDSLLKGCTTIVQLDERVERMVRFYKLSPFDLQSSLSRIPMNRPDLIHNFKDFELLISRAQYWSETRGDEVDSPIERPLLELLKSTRAEQGSNSSMNYDPIIADRSHRALQARLKELGVYPKDYAGLKNVFLLLTSRGVSTITDDILAELLANGTPEQIHDLRENAVKQGRVFDQGLRDEFAIRQLLESEPYLNLLKLDKSQTLDREALLKDVLALAQELMSDLGHRYVQFTEELSAKIQASYSEAKMIYEARAKRLIEKHKAVDIESDNRLAALQKIIPYIKEWSEKDQFEFLIYLRENANTPASDFIERQFPTFGPERVRRMFQGLPLQAAMSVVDIYLKETLLARKSVQEGYGSKLITYLVSKGTDEETRKYATLLLEGLLEGLRTRSSKRYQTRVLSALVAMRSDNSKSVGETLKVILEQFPGVGPKIGQFLVGVGILPFEINEVLKTTQDSTLPPKYFEMYSDLKSIVKRGDDIGIDLVSLLGSGSLKYSVEGIDRNSGSHVALQIFREDVQNNSDFQIGILQGMIEYLVRVGGREWGYLQVIVDGAANAVQREKRVLREAGKTALARRIYSNFSDDKFLMQVPEQQLVNERLLVARFAKGTSFKKLSNEDKVATGLKILAVEADILFQEQRDVIWYDADRHAGNYLIQVNGKGANKKYEISPIDFGQMTYIRRDQRERIVELFALAGILGQVGANDWLATKISEIFSLNAKQSKNLKEVLPLYFKISKKNSEAMVVTHYFNLLAAINESVKDSTSNEWNREFKTGKLDFAYTDFVRALIQLNQYEDEIILIQQRLPEETKSPSLILEARAKDKLSEYIQKMDYSLKQKTVFGSLNAIQWLKTRKNPSNYRPFNLRPTRSDLDQINVMNRNSKIGLTTLKGSEPAVTGPYGLPNVPPSPASNRLSTFVGKTCESLF